MKSKFYSELNLMQKINAKNDFKKFLLLTNNKVKPMSVATHNLLMTVY